jgi:hypothetical protein
MTDTPLPPLINRVPEDGVMTFRSRSHKREAVLAHALIMEARGVADGDISAWVRSHGFRWNLADFVVETMASARQRHGAKWMGPPA